ncbi:MAG: hypothetical protein QOJ50_2676 [Cryptosporangiaceae bacterium]|jgi:coenzyme F420 biosynthesis associated uncharacterized protein|nr:hypothetical protein [Cryptosporangiaceae bacterium]
MTTTQMVDWDLAVATAGALAKTGPRVTFAEASDVVGQLRTLTAEAERHVREYTGLHALVEHPPVRVVDRKDWVAANVEGLQKVIDPLIGQLTAGQTPGNVARVVGSKATGVQAGSVFAYLSGKVLGQYEVFAGEPGQLLLVAPNIVEAERRLEVDPRDFRLWICLHEVTHRTQFTAVPWLRQHFIDEVRAFVDAAELDKDALAARLRRSLDSIAEALKNPRAMESVIDLVQTPAQRAVLARLTALMTLVEGHAEFVMDGVGPDVVPSVASIREKFNARRVARNPLERILRKLLGVEVKMKQYAEGNRFVAAVVGQVGMEKFNKIWESAETLPKPEELKNPSAWVARVHGPAA